MMPSSSSPKLPSWVFLVTDAVLLATAWFIASRSPGPLHPAATYVIVACVIVGAIVGTVPLVLHYERVKNETLDDRQRSLEALAATLTDAAQQISIAAQGLNGIAELAQKNLKQAEQVPRQLQEKLAEVQAMFAGVQDEERDEMKKELAALRAVDSERLAAIADKVQKSAAELAKIEAAAQKSLAAVQVALARAPETVASATNAALAEIETKLLTRTTAVLAALEAVETKRTRRPKVEESAAPATPVAVAAPFAPRAPVPDVGTHIQPIVPPTAAPFAGHIISLGSTPAETAAAPESTVIEPPPAPISPPVSRSTVDAPVVAETAPVAVAANGSSTPGTEESKAARKPRAPRKPKPVENPDVGLDLGIIETAPAAANEYTQVSPDDSAHAAPEPALSSDGATRLLVTAYIGIGNRLFIRGEGPGLTWEKGVPLQFISIGKWRWENADAAAPVKFKLYKNDEIECTALGPRTLESGHQQEVTATF